MSDLIVPTYTVPQYNIQESTGCIPVENVTAMLPNLVLKTDAIKLGVACFIAGLVLMYIMIWYRDRSK